MNNILRLQYFLFFTSLFLLFVFNSSLAATNQQDADTLFSITKYTLADANSHLETAIPYDLNQDGYLDIVYQVDANNNSSLQWTQKIHFLPGSETGFDTTGIVPLFEDPNIINIFLGDWDGDSNVDIIAQKSREVSGGGYTGDLMQIWFMNKTSIIDTMTFFVPYEIYLGNKSNAKELQQLLDVDLDGKVDMMFAGFSHVTIGWNNGGGKPTFDQITNEGFNTYNARILDYNQDGYPDFINDDQYSDRPVIHLNRKDRSFLPKISPGLPSWNINNPSSMYWGFEAFWLNEDHYPDLLTRKAGVEFGGSQFEIYEYDTDESSYSKSNLQFPASNQYGEITPFHFNNDGYIDFIEVNLDKFKVWLNTENSTFNTLELDIKTGYNLKNLYKVDADNDNDLDILFSFPSEDTLFQIVNTQPIINEAPTSPLIDSLSVSQDILDISWAESSDDISLNGHLNYGIKLQRDDTFIDINLHSNNINLTNLPAGSYSLTFTASDPLGYTSDIAEAHSFVVIPTTIEQKKDIPKQVTLNQNYPNPFNPSTEISYQLADNSLVRLEVFDVTGRKVAVLVDGERKATGTHQVTFNAGNLASGVYFYRLETAGQTLTQKMLLVK